MYSVVVAFGLASVMLCIGMAIRAKVKFFQHMLMPVSVIGGRIYPDESGIVKISGRRCKCNGFQ